MADHQRDGVPTAPGLERRVEQLERVVAGAIPRGVRRRSERVVFGMPLWEIAVGPDPETGETRGHAHAMVAIGDLATGLLALGGFARGAIALGGVAVGLISIGGCSLGLLLALGGMAVGGVALGGAAIGVVAVGGGALGYYAAGGGAFGEHVISAARQDPEAVDFFKGILPLLRR